MSHAQRQRPRETPIDFNAPNSRACNSNKYVWFKQEAGLKSGQCGLVGRELRPGINPNNYSVIVMDDQFDDQNKCTKEILARTSRGKQSTTFRV